MSGYTVDLEWEQVDAIIVKELKRLLAGFQPENRPRGGIFVNDEEEDLEEMKKMRKALIRVLNWLTTEDERDWKGET